MGMRLRSSSFAMLLFSAAIISVMLTSGCANLSSELGLNKGSGQETGSGVGYGPSGAPNQTGQNNQINQTPAAPGANGQPAAPPSAPPAAPPAEADWIADGLESCGTEKAILAEMPLAAGDFAGITPLGNLNPPGHTFPTDHVYFMLRKLNPFAAERAFVVSPADAWVTRISSSEHVSDNFTDYTIDFSPCRELVFRFGHMSSLSDRLMQNLTEATGDACDEYETGGKRYRNCADDVMIRVSASEVIGAAGGNPGQFALDFWAFDARTALLNYANRARWYDQQSHVVCPLNYFKAAAKITLEGMLMSEGGTKRTIPPVCGEVEQDEPGTAQGAWFLKGTKSTYPEDSHAALVHDNFDPSRGAFSVGTSMQKSGLAAGVYYFQPDDIGYVNRDFAGVRADGRIYCYDASQDGGRKQVIILQLTGETALRMERTGAATCSESEPWAFGNGYTDFER